MALGLLFRVSWICFLLFSGCAALPAIKGYGHPYRADSHNLGDDLEDDVLNAATSDQTDWVGSYSHVTGPAYSSLSVPQQPDSVPSSQDLTKAPSVPKVRLVNGQPRDWGLDHLDKPITFPLNPSYQPGDVVKSQSGPMQYQAASPGVALSPITISATSGARVSEVARPVNGDPKDWGLDHLDKMITHYAGPTVYSQPNPLLLSQATNSGSKFLSFEPEPVSSYYFKGADSGFGSPNQNIDSSVKGGYSTDSPHFIYEAVFEYPAAENTEGGLPYLGYGDDSHRMEEYDIVHEPSKASRVTEPILPPPQPSYIVQSRSGYRRHRFFTSKTRYEPALSPPANVGSKGVARPAPSRLISIPGAGSKGARNPQRSKW